MIEGFDVEGVIMSKLRVLCIFFFWKGRRWIEIKEYRFA